MKTIVVSIANPADGDLVIINVHGRSGGKTSVKHTVTGPRKIPIMDEAGFLTGHTPKPGESQRDVAASLAHEINQTIMPECAHAKTKGDSGALIINCTSLYDDITFSAEVHGKGGTTVTLDEF